MRYLSTRGHADRKRFCEILLEGLAPDGGLYLPEHYPQVDAQTLAQWRAIWLSQGYAGLAFAAGRHVKIGRRKTFRIQLFQHFQCRLQIGCRGCDIKHGIVVENVRPAPGLARLIGQAVQHLTLLVAGRGEMHLGAQKIVHQ